MKRRSIKIQAWIGAITVVVIVAASVFFDRARPQGSSTQSIPTAQTSITPSGVAATPSSTPESINSDLTQSDSVGAVVDQSSIPAPANSTVTGSFTAADGKSGVTAYSVAGTVSDVASQYVDVLETAGFTVDTIVDLADGKFFSAKKGSISISATLANDQQNQNTTVVTVALTLNQ